MLNGSLPPLHRPAPIPRWLPLAQGWWRCARALSGRTLGGIALLAGGPTVIVLTQGGHDFGFALLVAALVVGAAMAFTVEDPAAETLAASPTSLARRRLVRASVLVASAMLLGIVLVVLADARGEVTAEELGRRAAELAAVAGIATAAAGQAHRVGLPGAALGGAMAASLVTLVVSSLSFRYDALPSLVTTVHHERWWWIAVAGCAVTAWVWRDPARR